MICSISFRNLRIYIVLKMRRNIQIFIVFLLYFPFASYAQTELCDQFTNFDKFNTYYCDECPNLVNTVFQHYISSELNFELDVPASFKIVEFYKDNKILIYDSLASKNNKSINVSLLDNNLNTSLDAFFLEYINIFFENFILDENQFFNYGNFQSLTHEGRYLYRSYTQGEDNLFELSIFYYKRPNMYLVRFMGFQNNYYELLCEYLPVAYSFKSESK